MNGQGTTEPAAIGAAIKEALSAVIKLVVIFGIITMTNEQFGALMITVDALLAAAMVLFIRTRSTSLAAPSLAKGSEVKVTDKAGNVETKTV